MWVQTNDLVRNRLIEESHEGTVANCVEPLGATNYREHPMSRNNRTHGSAMLKFVKSCLLLFSVASLSLAMTGCTTGSNGLASSPVFPPSTLDYSSQLEKLQARRGGSPYAPPGGFDNAASRPSLFSGGSGTRTGSC